MPRKSGCCTSSMAEGRLRMSSVRHRVTKSRCSLDIVPHTTGGITPAKTASFTFLLPSMKGNFARAI
eukprot:CAMPEP_0175708604 /NCGR_PEP_ID=MMETSP0097-20121207/39150_1 /TAXON_ID=311494 /ORGANISM="Alexandrium monilatum, Strain CCMP3105" /LENGTH=66 /DNA_ID=CAMNT_0017015993 /DNA_START=236 /DNA_END=436 /DNA_ORIENTATION=-